MADDQLLNLTRVVLQFGDVQRQTENLSGSPESDTTHTVMLQLVCRLMLRACAVPGCSCRFLNPLAVMDFALVHDLQEFRHGDVPTLRISADQRAAKETNEAAGLAELGRMFPGSWLCNALRHYHAQDCREARYVRAMDKNLPKLTHLCNNLSVLRKLRMTREEFRQRIIVEQSAEMSEYAGEFLCVMMMHGRLAERIEALLPETWGDRGTLETAFLAVYPGEEIYRSGMESDGTAWIHTQSNQFFSGDPGGPASNGGWRFCREE